MWSEHILCMIQAFILKCLHGFLLFFVESARSLSRVVMQYKKVGIFETSFCGAPFMKLEVIEFCRFWTREGFSYLFTYFHTNIGWGRGMYVFYLFLMSVMDGTSAAFNCMALTEWIKIAFIIYISSVFLLLKICAYTMDIIQHTISYVPG